MIFSVSVFTAASLGIMHFRYWPTELCLDCYYPEILAHITKAGNSSVTIVVQLHQIVLKPQAIKNIAFGTKFIFSKSHISKNFSARAID